MWVSLCNEGAFYINILRPHHQSLALTCGSAGASEKSRELDWEVDQDGRPYIHDSQALFNCTILDLLKVGTHAIVVGEVKSVSYTDQPDPFFYYDRGFGRPQIN